MHIERNHHTGQAQAIGSINALLDELMGRPLPGGVAIRNVSRNWSGNTLNFSFRAQKGFLGATLAGMVRVNNHSMMLDCDLPGLVTSFVGEDKIREAIHQQLDGLFPAGSGTMPQR
jgi:hypothetical protein